jgi:hypothetical protein
MEKFLMNAYIMAASIPASAKRACWMAAAYILIAFSRLHPLFIYS